jgi:histidyl-tRNA synthetase
MAYKGNMKKRMQKADAAGARFAVILGDDELARGEAAVKTLATGEQASVPLDRLAAWIGVETIA